MDGVNQPRAQTRVRVTHIGGIDETEVTLPPGVSVLAGQNATNRTSLLRAIMAALGSEQLSLKRDADEGSVQLELDGETYTRTLRRSAADGVEADGSPYLDDPESADLFAFLLESNEARQAVARGLNLRDVIMRPVDTDAIEREIDQLIERRDRVDARLDELDELERRLPELVEERDDRQRELDETRGELERIRAEIEEADRDLEQSKERQAERKERLEALNEARAELQDVEYDIETEKQRRETLQEERADLRAELRSLPEAPGDRIDQLDDQIDQLRRHKSLLESTVNTLQNVIRFNEDMLDGDALDALDDLEPEDESSFLGSLRQESGVDILGALRGDTGDDVTDQLVEGRERVRCWTCGSDVQRQQITTTLDGLQEIRRNQLEMRNSLESDLDDLQAERDDLVAQRQQRETARRQIDQLENDLESNDRRIETLERRKEEIHDRIETLERRIEDLQEEDYSEVLELHKRANELEVDCARLRDDRDELDDEIDTVERRLDDRSDLDQQRDEVSQRLEELRTTTDRLERRAVEAFNEHMDAILDALSYSNVERIWLERTGSDDDRRFSLHIVRGTDAGTVYEDTIEHLSESEREVTGLIFALAGYLAHEVYDEVPFMILDSLEAIDSSRIARLVDYLRQYAPYLVVALLPEDAQALDSEYHYVRTI